MKKGQLGGTSVAKVRSLLIASGLEAQFVHSRIALVKGFFSQSLKTYSGPIAFLHLDVDLYDSYRACLAELYPKVVPGGVVAFDEYMGGQEQVMFPGAKKAIDEYFGDDASLIQRDPVADKYFLVKGVA